MNNPHNKISLLAIFSIILPALILLGWCACWAIFGMFKELSWHRDSTNWQKPSSNLAWMP